MQGNVGNKTVGGLLAFLNQMVEKGRARAGAIKPLDTAIRKVFSTVAGESWEQLDVSSVDVDDYMLRFGNMTNGVYTTSSLSVYKSRINKSLTWYEKFLSTPGWVPPLREAGREKDGPKTKPVSTKKAPNTEHATPDAPTPEQESPAERQHKEGMISYPLPLASGKVIQLYLPVKLTQSDARRIGAFVTSLAFEEASGNAEAGEK